MASLMTPAIHWHRYVYVFFILFTCINAYPSSCWRDDTPSCTDNCDEYLEFVNDSDDDGVYTTDDLCCVYAEDNSDTSVAYAGCIICVASGGNAYCQGSYYNCFTECNTNDCNNPSGLVDTSGTCIISDDDNYDDSVNTTTFGVLIVIIVVIVVCCCIMSVIIYNKCKKCGQSTIERDTKIPSTTTELTTMRNNNIDT